MPLLTIASLTLREAARRRLMTAVGALALLVIGLTAWAFSKLATVAGPSGAPLPPVEKAATFSVLVLLLAYMFSVVLAIGAAFLAAPAIAGDVESGIALAMLPRPIRRSDVVLGKWLGLTVLIAAFTAAIGAVELGLVYRITGYLPPHPGRSIAFLIAESVVLLTLGLFLSTRMATITSGIIAVVLFGVAWIAGIAETLGLIFHNQQLVSATTAISLLLPTDGLWRAAAFNLEPAVMAVAAMTNVDRQAPFMVGAPPPPAYLLWSAGWVVAMLAAAVVSFNRRDL